MIKEIKRAEEMPKAPLAWDKMDEDWGKRLEEMGKWWYQKHPVGSNPKEQAAMDKMVKLRDRLLEFGGNIACMDLTDAHYDAIMERGQYFYGEGIHHTKGFPSQCHYNACAFWAKHQLCMRIATGYALSKDGCWRQHSWLVEPLKTKYRIWETTEDRIAYFGVILTQEECEEFCELELSSFEPELARRSVKYDLRQVVDGEYVATPIKNTFNSKTSYWMTKKDYTVAVYMFTAEDCFGIEDFEARLTKDGLQEYKALFRNKFEDDAPVVYASGT